MKVTEGDVKIEVPDGNIYEADVFYNPEMEFNRDISVAAVSVIKDLLEADVNGCDLLSASGVRGLRYIKESGISCHLNDYIEKAVDLIKNNCKLNNVETEVSNLDGNVLLRQNNFNFIDIDPFGSPIHFIESAVRSLPRKGFIAFTATDTAPLSGTYPQRSLRRYGIRSMKTDYFHELGIRIMITSIMRKFFQEEKAFYPVMSYSHLHYFRVFGRTEKGNKKVDELLDQFKPISHCFECGWRDLVLEKACPLCKSKTRFIESVYMGPIQDKEFLKKVGEELESRKLAGYSFVNNLAWEADAPLYIDTHVVAGKLKKDVPRIDEIVEKVKEKGYNASRTHFCDTAVKTNMPYSEFIRLF